MIRTSINFLQKHDLYVEEKPYVCNFAPDEGFPRTNIKLNKLSDLEVEDVRGREADLSLDRNGFALIRLDTSMSYEDYDSKDKIKSLYAGEVAEALRLHMKAARVQIFENVVRKRHPTFPISTGESYEYNQPTSIAHIDTTRDWTEEMVRKLNPTDAEELLKHEVLCVNVWRPLKGPVRDWPLALCDASTVNQDDLLPGDVVYRDYAVENMQVHYSPGQKWYYIRDQEPTEAWVFVQSSSMKANAGVPHSSFQNPNASPNDVPRESIEVRALVYFSNEVEPISKLDG